MLYPYAEYECFKAKARRKILQLRSSESGATAIEYGLIAALIAVVVIGAITAIGTSLNSKFNSVANNLH